MLMTGYGPLGLAVAVAERARRARRPIAVLPLMHADDPLHHLPVLLDHLRAADQVLALTEFEAAHIRTLTGHSEVHVIGGGVNLDELEAPHVSGARFRQRHGLGSGPLALYLGRKESGKRYPLALEAVRRSANPDLRLVLIGPDVDGVPVSEPRAVYLGPRPREEVLDALDACDVLINPSTSESFGLTVLEAWARRKPVIVNAQCGPFRAIVRDGQDGLWAGDSAAMTRALDRLLADPVLAIRLGLAGRARLADYFNWPATAARTQAAIQGR
jgi:glycosyltransferase involved in cell wall biosynthesis